MTKAVEAGTKRIVAWGRSRRRGVLITWATVLATSIVLGSCGYPTGSCGSIQERVDAASEGTTVDLPDGCTYREEVTINKALRLVGSRNPDEPVAILGSDEWDGWTQRDGRWTSKRSLPDVSPVDEKIREFQDPCKEGTERCKWPEQVFIDGQPLEQVASDPGSGQFAVSADGKVLIADDPGGRKVEVTVRRRWIVGRSKDVTVEGFTMRHAANAAQTGALDNNGYADWTIRNNNLSYAHGVNVSLGGATNLKVLDNRIHHAGQLGLNGADAELEVVGNEIHHNNTEDFDPSWVAGGVKIADCARFEASGNEVHHNDQTGIWTDTGARDVILSDNRVHHNTKQGIRLEITDQAVASGNVLYENGSGETEAGDEGAGISVASSRDVEIYDNVLAWNAAGIAVVNSQRENGVGGSNPKFSTVSNVRVHHNTILSEAPPSGEYLAIAWRKAYAGGDIYEPSANNRGYDNSYWYPSPEGTRPRFLWETGLERLDVFNSTPGEQRGRYLSDREKNQVLMDAGVPASHGSR